MPPRPRTSVTWDGSSLAPLLNRIGILLPRNWHSHARHGSRQPVLRTSARRRHGCGGRCGRAVGGCARGAGRARCCRRRRRASSSASGSWLRCKGRDRRPRSSVASAAARSAGSSSSAPTSPSPSQLRQLTAELQSAARAAGRPPLLIATDQEGGRVRRLPWAGPVKSATRARRVERGEHPASGAPRRPCAPGGRGHRRSRAGGGRAGAGVVHGRRRQDLRRVRGVVGRRGDRVRARARGCEGRRDREALPGDRQGDAATPTRRSSRSARAAVPSRAIWRRSAPRSAPACRW